jgi:hypothetical protein
MMAAMVDEEEGLDPDPAAVVVNLQPDLIRLQSMQPSSSCSFPSIIRIYTSSCARTHPMAAQDSQVTGGFEVCGTGVEGVCGTGVEETDGGTGVEETGGGTGMEEAGGGTGVEEAGSGTGVEEAGGGTGVEEAGGGTDMEEAGGGTDMGGVDGGTRVVAVEQLGFGPLHVSTIIEFLHDGTPGRQQRELMNPPLHDRRQSRVK